MMQYSVVCCVGGCILDAIFLLFLSHSLFQSKPHERMETWFKEVDRCVVYSTVLCLHVVVSVDTHLGRTGYVTQNDLSS